MSKQIEYLFKTPSRTFSEYIEKDLGDEVRVDRNLYAFKKVARKHPTDPDKTTPAYSHIVNMDNMEDLTIIEHELDIVYDEQRKHLKDLIDSLSSK